MPTTEAVTAAGGVVYRRNNDDLEVLLIFRRGLWDLPKGKLEEGESIPLCARREVAEEVGLSVLPKIVKPLPDTYHEYEQAGTKYGKTTHWFAMQLQRNPSGGFNPETKEGIEKVKWVPLPMAQRWVGFENLVEVLHSFQESVS
jgi:8-oxo-dGTP pyrophosphatase MutT (NUDIX family)